MIPPILLAMYIFTQPESPRWLLAKALKTENKKTKSDYYKRTFYDLTKLRNSELLAARDMILMHYRLRKEEQRRQEPGTVWYRRGVYELFAIGRNRRALTASLIVMFFQQFCGINVLIYYSSSVLLAAKYPANQALLVSRLRLQRLGKRCECNLTDVTVVNGCWYNQLCLRDPRLLHDRQIRPKELAACDVSFSRSVSAAECYCIRSRKYPPNYRWAVSLRCCVQSWGRLCAICGFSHIFE